MFTRKDTNQSSRKSLTITPQRKGKTVRCNLDSSYGWLELNNGNQFIGFLFEISFLITRKAG